MTVQPSSFFVAALSAAALLLVSGNTTSAHSHKNNGPVINGLCTGRDRATIRSSIIRSMGRDQPTIRSSTARSPRFVPGLGIPHASLTIRRALLETVTLSTANVCRDGSAHGKILLSGRSGHAHRSAEL
jgi:hypothetical protein